MRLKTALLLALTCVLTLGAQTAFAQFGPAIGNITSAGSTCSTTSPSSNCVTLKLDASTGAATILITNTFVGTAQFEVSNDGLSTWTNISCTPPNSTTAASSATSTGSWQCNVAGWEHIRVRCSAYTSGTISVVINGAHASAKSGGGSSLPALSDNGTVVSSTERLNITAAADTTTAAIQMNSVTTTGFMFGASTLLGLKVDATHWLANSSSANTELQVPSSGFIGWSSSTTFGGAANDTMLARESANFVRIGRAALGGPTAASLQIGESGSGSNIAGSSGTIRAGVSTGNGAGTKFCIQRNLMAASSSTPQATIDGYCVGPSKTLSNTTATAQSLVNISVPSNSAGGSEGTITVTCTDGTNFDSETQSFNVSYVNKATVLTIGAPVITTTSAANNSGSCTVGMTATAGTNSVDIKVTPAFTTIVPTTVTSYIALRNNGTGNVTFN